jgi:hypothetical protein
MDQVTMSPVLDDPAVPTGPDAPAAFDDLEVWARDYPPHRDPKPEGVFEIGFCMAGAVSAGAYTAGVLDVFVEALDALTAERDARARDGRPSLHEVRVPVLGGASAGGMCAALAAVFIDKAFPPARPGAPADALRRNPLWRAWVSDIDIARLLGTADLRAGGRIDSLLDCTVLEEIVDGLLDESLALQPRRRPWLASPLRAVLTLSNLRGVPYALSFQGAGAGGFRHWMSEHADHLRYAIPLDPRAEAQAEDPPKVGETVLDRAAAARGTAVREAFRQVALGTGGFPVALAPRVVRRPAADYLYRAALTPTGPFRRDVVYRPRPVWADGVTPAWGAPAPRDYEALCADGGAMNNEPLDLVRRVLVGHGPSTPKAAVEARRALLLVDPFVKPGQPGPEAAQGLIGSILPLFNALVRNARFKPEDLAAAANPAIGSRFLLAPSRGAHWEAEAAIAAGHLGGFMGFFAEAYRAHDFRLGRRNAQRFLRTVFVLPEGNPLFAEGRWGERDREHWGVTREGVGGRHLPIVPLCGALGREEEPLPDWPRAEDYPAEAVSRLVAERARVAVPALTEAAIGLALSKSGFWPWLGRQGVRGLARLLRPRLVEGILERLQREAKALAEAPHRHRPR